MRWASALSGTHRGEAAAREAASALRERLGREEPQLLLLFVSEDHRQAYERILEILGNEFSAALLLGCGARSVIGGGRELEEQPGLAVSAAVLPEVALRPFHLDLDTQPRLSARTSAWHDHLGFQEGDQPHIVLLADPFSSDCEGLVQSLDASFPTGVKIGGLASAGPEGGNALFLGKRIHESGIVGVALLGNLTLEAVVAQGCRPVGNPMFVTRCRDQLLLELDGGAPVTVLEQLYAEADERDRSLLMNSLFIGIERKEGMNEYHQGDFLIRNLIGMDRDSGALAVAAPLSMGQVVQFHLRDARASAEELEQRLTLYRQRSNAQAAPEGALLFSCLGRGRGLYGRSDHDTDAFRRHLGDLPLTGFFCNGEIGPVQGTTFLHGYTSAFGIFSARR